MSNQHITLEMDNKENNLSPVMDEEKKPSSSLNTDVDTLDGRNVRIPRAVPEVDEEEDDDRPYVTEGQKGIDDGLLNGNDNRGARPRRPSYAFPGYEGPGMVDYNGIMTPIPDVNAYQHKKTLAQGMMDLALLSANANQLRYVLENYRNHMYATASLIFISLSIIFQVAVGVGLILNGRLNIKDEKEICHANKINDYTVIGVFIITVVNVFISAFGVADPAPMQGTT